MSLEASGEAGLEAEGEVAAREFILKVSPIIKLSNYPLQPASVLQGWDKIIGEMFIRTRGFCPTGWLNYFCLFPCFQRKAIKPNWSSLWNLKRMVMNFLMGSLELFVEDLRISIYFPLETFDLQMELQEISLFSWSHESVQFDVRRMSTSWNETQWRPYEHPQ